MSVNPLPFWLALHHLPGLGAVRIHRLFEQFGSAQAILEAPRPLLLQCGLNAAVLEVMEKFLQAPSSGSLGEAVSRSLAWAEQPDHHLLCLEQEEYPALLRWIPDPPPLLYIRGRLQALRQPQIAIVGSRNPTAGGLDNARAFGGSLARGGLTVTSGLALGVDAAAHEAALKAGAETIAVLGTGVDTPYPASNLKLAAAVVAQGALVSEFPLGTLPKPAHFPRRNRIISGLSMGTLVVEASLRSGSLITARQALEQGREVYALPGSIHNPQARGCHHLIKQGAKLVETVEDILEELPALLAHYQSLPADQAILPQQPVASGHSQPVNLTLSLNRPGQVEAETPSLELSSANGIASASLDTAAYMTVSSEKVLQALGYDAVSADVLVERTGLPSQAISAELMALELCGLITRTTGGYQRC